VCVCVCVCVCVSGDESNSLANGRHVFYHFQPKTQVFFSLNATGSLLGPSLAVLQIL
jgi:hypothetical protein